MAREIQLPCDGEDVCMLCKMKSLTDETIMCTTCNTPWHMPCLTAESLASSSSGIHEWWCPDCSSIVDPLLVSQISGFESSGSDLVSAVRVIEADTSLTEEMKAKKRQKLMSGKANDEDEKSRKGKNIMVENDDEEMLDSLRKMFKCPICLELPERPITTPCGHNFCLKCFVKWIGQGKFNYVQCRSSISKKAARNIRINLAIVDAIRLAKNSKRTTTPTPKIQHHIRNEDLPEEAFTIERAVKNGLANATSGKIKVTIPKDHFGPITAEYDPTRNQGVLVGESWGNRQVCKQWGAHFPHVSGIAGQERHGAQSVVIFGGYQEDEDHGEWFLYTGSGGRDLKGNKRANPKQSFNQTFRYSNEALRLSCKMGYPVRVVRSEKEKHSAYALVEGVRYDGVYRVEKCWRKIGIQGFIICRYLFVRCDNEAAPWTINDHDDSPKLLPDIPELKKATDLFVREESPSWDFDESEGRWKWMKPPPASKNLARMRKARNATGNNTIKEKLLKQFNYQICRNVMSLPVTTPCGHNFCKACLEARFTGIAHVRERIRGGRTLRAKKNIMICPSCPMDIADFLQNPQVNREIMDVIEKLTNKEEEEPELDNASSKEGEENSEKTTDAKSGENTDSEDEEDEDEEGEGEEEEEEEEDEDEDEDEEEFDIDVSEAEEPPSKRMKLDGDTLSSSHCE